MPCHGEDGGIYRRRGGETVARLNSGAWRAIGRFGGGADGAAVHDHYSGRLLTSARAEEMTTPRFHPSFRAISPISLPALAHASFRANSPPQAEPGGRGLA